MANGQCLRIRPSDKLEGTVMLPGDKSLSHRALLLASLCEGESTIKNCLYAGVTKAMIECLKNLGVEIHIKDQQAGSPKGSATVVIRGRGMRGWKEPDRVLDCGGSATTMRLMAGILAGQPFESKLDGNARLRERPMGRIVIPLSIKGSDIRTANGNAPLSLFPSELKTSSHRLPVASAQVKSALLFAGLFTKGSTTVSEPHASRDHTERMLRELGVHVDEWEDKAGRHVVRINEGIDRLPCTDRLLPSDPSAAAFIVVAGLIVPESNITIPNVCVNPGRNGLLSVLQRAGAKITMKSKTKINDGEPAATIQVTSGQLRSISVRGQIVPTMIDEFPIFAVAATQAKGTTVVKDAEELRLKESDRIQALSEELSKLGARIEPGKDGFVVYGPTRLKGTRVNAKGDHRLAMSLAVAGLVAEGETLIEGWEVMNESFPEFPLVLRRLGAEVSW